MYSVISKKNSFFFFNSNEMLGKLFWSNIFFLWNNNLRDIQKQLKNNKFIIYMLIFCKLINHIWANTTVNANDKFYVLNTKIHYFPEIIQESILNIYITIISSHTQNHFGSICLYLFIKRSVFFNKKLIFLCIFFKKKLLKKRRYYFYK